MKKPLLVLPLLAVVLLGAAYSWWQRPTPLAETDLLLIGDLANQSGEPIFDHSLSLALRTALSQSPHLNLIADQKARNALKMMGKSEQEPLTENLAKAICANLGAKAYLTGNLSKTGTDYTFELEAKRCPDGSRLAHAEGTAARSDLLIRHLGIASARLRTQLGESEESVQRLNCPLERATTPLPAALQSYARARQAVASGLEDEAVPQYKKAIELDSRFSLARSGLAVTYYNLSQMTLAGEEIRQAYEAADRQTLRERLTVTTLYYDLAQGDVDKAIEGYKQYIREYPRDDVALGNLSSEFFVIGDYEQAAKYSQAALKLDPDSAAWYENYSTALMALSRLDEAEKLLKEAFSRKLDDAALHSNRYTLGFLKGDKALMDQELAWAASKPSSQDSILAMQSDTESYFGRLRQARQYTDLAVEAAQKADLVESAGTWKVESALREAIMGNPAEARKNAEEALKLAPDSKDVQALAALVFARVGDGTKAQSIMDNLRALYVSNTAIQKAWLPVVRAQMAMHVKHHEEALQILEIVAPYEKGQLTGNLSDSCMLPAYLRAEAYLELHRGHEALNEFHKILSAPGVTGSCWSGPLSVMGSARAAAQSGSMADARTSYQKFFDLWKDGDNDNPLLKQAKAEAAKLH